MKLKLKPFAWERDTLFLLDQRLLPHQQRYVPISTSEQCFTAIHEMVVRGAPLIGFTAVWGMALWLKNNSKGTLEEFLRTCYYLQKARPTAVNLEYELGRVRQLAEEYYRVHRTLAGFYPRLVQHAESQVALLEKHNLALAQFAEKELAAGLGNKKLSLLTICNTGTLACGCMGTALGIIQYLHSLGRLERVFVSETRPFLQGSRLTSYELLTEGIAHEIVTEGAASYLCREKLVDAVFAGADRIAANGDTANKIGTSGLSIIARYYKVPFYIAAPLSSFHLDLPSGREIKIELRDGEEILSWQGRRIAPAAARALNPSFDVTDAANITAIICEKGVIAPVNAQMISAVAGRK